MDDENFLVDLVLKPRVSRHPVRPEECQLLLAYLSEILREMESEEQEQQSQHQREVV